MCSAKEGVQARPWGRRSWSPRSEPACTPAAASAARKKGTRAAARSTVSRSRASWSARRASGAIVSASGFQITTPASADHDRLEQPGLALEESGDGLEKTGIRGPVETDPVGEDVLDLGVGHQHLEQGADLGIGRQQPAPSGIARARVPVVLEDESKLATALAHPRSPA